MLKDVKQYIIVKRTKGTISLAQAKNMHAKKFVGINQE